jgi:dihydrofolate reductase
MRKIILFMVYSLDGFICGPNNELDWENRNEEVGAFLIPDLLKRVDSTILGKNLFTGFEQYWPSVAQDTTAPKELSSFAQWLVDSPKYVLTSTLTEVSWNNSHIIKATTDVEIVQEVTKLKKQKGGDIVLFGGAQMAQTVVRLGLVDEYILKVQPVALGKGKALFVEKTHLKLISSHEFSSGVVSLTYANAKNN